MERRGEERYSKEREKKRKIEGVFSRLSSEKSSQELVRNQWWIDSGQSPSLSTQSGPRLNLLRICYVDIRSVFFIYRAFPIFVASTLIGDFRVWLTGWIPARLVSYSGQYTSYQWALLHSSNSSHTNHSLVWLSPSRLSCRTLSFRGNSDTEAGRLDQLWSGLTGTLNPDRLREISSPEEPLVDWNTLRKKGRRVGTHAATMTTFCSILTHKLAYIAKEWGRYIRTYNPQRTKGTTTQTNNSLVSQSIKDEKRILTRVGVICK